MRKLDDLIEFPLQQTYFPPLSEDRLRALADDIKRNGLRHSIEVLPENKAGYPADTIVKGHMRRLALLLNGETTAEVLVRYDLAEIWGGVHVCVKCEPATMSAQFGEGERPCRSPSRSRAAGIPPAPRAHVRLRGCPPDLEGRSGGPPVGLLGGSAVMYAVHIGVWVESDCWGMPEEVISSPVEIWVGSIDEVIALIRRAAEGPGGADFEAHLHDIRLEGQRLGMIAKRDEYRAGVQSKKKAREAEGERVSD
jgi:hypothetical protein